MESTTKTLSRRLPTLLIREELRKSLATVRDFGQEVAGGSRVEWHILSRIPHAHIGRLHNVRAEQQLVRGRPKLLVLLNLDFHSALILASLFHNR